VAINGFEGGQMPIYRRLPKRGFKNLRQGLQRGLARPHPGRHRRQEARRQGNRHDEALVKAGVVRRPKDGVRILSGGELKAKVAFEVAGASKAAIEKIEKAGGSVKLPEKSVRRSVTKCRAGASCPGLHIGGLSLISGRSFPRGGGTAREIATRLTEGLGAHRFARPLSENSSWHRRQNNLRRI
jgi:large subunit ribosomal protein L15